jgi:hypothetical protein
MSPPDDFRMISHDNVLNLFPFVVLLTTQYKQTASASSLLPALGTTVLTIRFMLAFHLLTISTMYLARKQALDPANIAQGDSNHFCLRQVLPCRDRLICAFVQDSFTTDAHCLV